MDRIRRPPPPAWDPACDRLLIQNLDIDHVTHCAPGSTEKRAVLRIFGCTPEGHSACGMVHGFEPYMMTDMPTTEDPEVFKAQLNRKFDGQPVTAVEVVRRQSLWGYSGDGAQPMMKIFTRLPNDLTTIRTHLEACGLRTYESNITFVLRFMVDKGVVGGGWVELPAGAWTPISRKETTCQVRGKPQEGSISKDHPSAS